MIPTNLEKVKSEITDKVIDMLADSSRLWPNQREAYKEQLRERISSRTMVTELREQSGLSDAYAYNQTAYELYLDILTTFGYIDRLYDTISAHRTMNESVINSLYVSINDLNDKIDEYAASVGTALGPQCYIEGFRSQNGQEFDQKYYKERYGERVRLATWAKFNGDQENLTINYTRQQNTMVYKSGVQLGEIEITKQYGAAFIKARNSETKLENAIDTSASSYWADTILAPAELKVRGMGFDKESELGRSNRSFYDLPRGALCEICLTFEAMSKVNEIVLNPFGNFPIDIVAIRYSYSDDEDDDVYNVLTPDGHPYEWLTTTSIKHEYAFHFPQINCKRLYILINQIHCIKDTYMLSCNQMFKNELWFNATYPETHDAIMDETTVFAPNYLDRMEESPEWRYINDKLVTNKILDINELLIDNNNKYVPVTRYQYTYGFYNIAPNYVEFQRAGFYVTKEIDADGPVDSIRLETNEEHYVTVNGYYATDIEYYITTKVNPDYNDWHPICPTNKNYVHRELLQLDYDYCYLLNKAICRNETTVDENGYEHIYMNRPKVYYNDITFIEDADYILRQDDDGYCYAIEISNIDYFSMYTVDYEPSPSSKELALITDDEPIPSMSHEEIEGNGTACYRLTEFPYYSKSNPDNTSSFVRLTSMETGAVLEEGVTSTYTASMKLDDGAYRNYAVNDYQIECVTNKLHTEDSYKNFVASTNKIQYYTNGRYLYFNRPIKKSEKIEINYPSFGSRIRLKAILRRNTKHDLWITPVLKSFKLEFTTL